MGIPLLWGIDAMGGNEKIALGGNESYCYEFVVQWVVVIIDMKGEWNNLWNPVD
jgi:hypothetical protein